MSRSHRSCRSVIANLPLDQLEEVIGWLVGENATYKTVQARLLEKWSVRLSIQSISEFYRQRVERLGNPRDQWIQALVKKKWKEQVATHASGPKRDQVQSAT